MKQRVIKWNEELLKEIKLATNEENIRNSDKRTI